MQLRYEITHQDVPGVVKTIKQVLAGQHFDITQPINRVDDFQNQVVVFTQDDSVFSKEHRAQLATLALKRDL